MPTTTRSRTIRLLVIGCGLFALLFSHVVLRYLTGTLFGFAEYRGLAPVVPFLLLGGYMLLLGVVATVVAVRRGISGIGIGTGMLVFAIEPVSSMYLWGDGCEVGSTTGAALLPEVAVEWPGVILYPWNGACSATLSTVLLGVGLLLVGSSLWRDNLPDVAFARSMNAIETSRRAD